MKYRVMSFNEEIKDFDSEAEAYVFYLAKKVIAEKAKIEVKDGMEVRPSVNIHRCYHSPDGNNQPCEIIEEYKK